MTKVVTVVKTKKGPQTHKKKGELMINDQDAMEVSSDQGCLVLDGKPINQTLVMTALFHQGCICTHFFVIGGIIGLQFSINMAVRPPLFVNHLTPLRLGIKMICVLAVLLGGGGGGPADSSDRLPDQAEKGSGACGPPEDPVRALPQELLCGGPRAGQDDS